MQETRDEKSGGRVMVRRTSRVLVRRICRLWAWRVAM